LYIRQQCLYSFEDALKMQAQTRLEKIFITLDLTSFIKKLPVSYHGGPDGYDNQNKLRAVIAAWLFLCQSSIGTSVSSTSSQNSSTLILGSNSRKGSTDSHVSSTGCRMILR
jgi:hypothetical protein